MNPMNTMDMALYHELLLVFAVACAKALGAGSLIAILFRIKV